MLPPDSKVSLAARVRLLLVADADLVEKLAEDSLPTVRASVAEFIGDSAEPRWTPTLAALLRRAERERDSATAKAGARAVVRLAHAIDVNHDLERAVIAAVDCFELHGVARVLSLAAAMLTPARLRDARSPLGRWFVTAKPASHAALRAWVRQARDPMAHVRAWQWLARPGVAAAAGDRLRQSASAAEHDAVLRLAHLAEAPWRRRRLPGLTGVKKEASGGGWWPGAEARPALSIRARRGLPRLVRASGASAGEAERLLEPAVADADALARLSALLAADALGARRLVEDMRFDPHPAIAACAARRLEAPARRREATDSPKDDRPEPALRAPHAEVRRLAAEDAARSAAPAAPRNIDAQPGGRGGRRPREDAPADCSDLFRAIDDPEPRARADAIDALAGIVRRGWAGADHAAAFAARLPGLKADGHHRVRAGAILAEMRLSARADASRPTAGTPAAPARGNSAAWDDAADMLADQRPAHRLAGLWLAERALLSFADAPGAAAVSQGPISGLRDTIAGLAEEDTDAAVQRRARRCGVKIRATTRERWRERAVAIG